MYAHVALALVFLLFGGSLFAQTIDDRFVPIGGIPQELLQKMEDAKKVNILIDAAALRSAVSAGTKTSAFWEEKTRTITLEPEKVRTAEVMERYAEALVLRDQRILSLAAREGFFEITYRVPGKIAGLFRTEIAAQIRAEVPLRASGEIGSVKVSYPWYHIFIRKDLSAKDLKQQFQAEAEIFNAETDMVRMAQYMTSISAWLFATMNT